MDLNSPYDRGSCGDLPVHRQVYKHFDDGFDVSSLFYPCTQPVVFYMDCGQSLLYQKDPTDNNDNGHPTSFRLLAASAFQWDGWGNTSLFCMEMVKNIRGTFARFKSWKVGV